MFQDLVQGLRANFHGLRNIVESSFRNQIFFDSIYRQKKLKCNILASDFTLEVTH